MLNDKKIRDYYFNRFLMSYLYNDTIYECVLGGTYDHYIFSKSFLKVLDEYVESYAVNNNCVCDVDSVKNKLYNLINYIRFEHSYENMEEKKLYYSFLNNLLSKLNLSKSIYYPFLMLIEFMFRTNIILKRRIPLYKYNMYNDFVKKSIGYDFIVFNLLISNTTDQSFDDFLINNGDNLFFLISLNSIICVCPQILQNELVIDRIKKVLAYNQKDIDNKHLTKEQKLIKLQVANLYEKL